ncbi:MAG: chorismate mutase [Bacteroides sp.]|nr:chorismate mutase [Bacteroides sp.]
MNNLADIRNQIDQLDKELVSLLVQRTNLALEAYKCKQKNTESVQGADRVKIVLDKVRALARENGENEEVIARIYEAIIKELTDL